MRQPPGDPGQFTCRNDGFKSPKLTKIDAFYTKFGQKSHNPEKNDK